MNQDVNDVKEILLSEGELDEITTRLAKEIEENYKDSKNLLLLGILKGSIIFMSDLIKKINLPIQIDFMKVSSYGASTKTTGKINIILDIHRTDLTELDILVVEDIIDSGKTLSYLAEYLRLAGAKTVKTVTLLDKPWDNQCYDAYESMIKHIKTKDGKWKFDYSIFDEYVEFGRSCGLGPVISCYTMCPWEYMVTWEDEDGAIHKVKAIPGTPEFKEYWSDFLVDFTQHLKSKGWFEDAVVSIDERSPDDVRNIAALIKEKAPGLKIAIAGNRPPSQFEGIEIHHACFGLHHLSDKLISEAADRKKKGMFTTFYVCCGPSYPNTMCHNELEEAFWLGVYSAMSGLDGFLRWAWNSWADDSINDASYTGIGGGWKAGDTYLVYPDGCPSLRFLELRNGIVAAEKIRILKENGLFEKDIGKLASKFNRKEAIANKANFIKLKSDVNRVVNK
jgi:hypoxanthine phosphoribosyltransferase